MTDFRALCAELVQAIESQSKAGFINHDLMSAYIKATHALTQPEPMGPTDEDFYELAEVFNGDPLPAMRRALELWAHPAITPIPVSERLPGPGDRDAEGRCWWWCTDGPTPGWILCTEAEGWTRWLPYYALPLPITTNDTP